MRAPSLMWLRSLVSPGLLLSAGVLIAPPSFADGPGTSAAQFLRLGYGTRSLGMGEAFTAVSDDVSALYYNPAGLAYGPAFQPNAGIYEAALTESLEVQNITMTQAGFVARPFGISVTRLDFGSLEGRSAETSAPDANFNAADMAIALSAAHQFEDQNLSVGMSGRFIQESIATYHATAYAADFGVIKRMYRLPISVGAAVTNVGTPVKFVSQANPLPMTIAVGAAYGMTKKFPHALALEIEKPNDGPAIVRLGFEYAGFGPLALRAGYRTYASSQRQAVIGSQIGQTYSGLSAFYGFFMGVGLRTKWGNLDYAMQPYGDLGMENRISVSMRFGARKQKAPADQPATRGDGGNFFIWTGGN